MPMPDWFDPSMQYGGAGMMQPPPSMPPGLLAQGGPPGGAPMAPPPPIPAAPSLPGITPQAAAQAGAPLTPQQQQAALQQAMQAFSQIRPPMPANMLNQMPGAGMPMPSALPAGGGGLPAGPGLRPMPMLPGSANLMQALQGGLGMQRPPLIGGAGLGGFGRY